MKCWCDGVDYTCFDCEKKVQWKSISKQTRMDLVALLRTTNKPMIDMEDYKYLLKKLDNCKLTIADIPKEVN